MNVEKKNLVTSHRLLLENKGKMYVSWLRLVKLEL